MFRAIEERESLFFESAGEVEVDVFGGGRLRDIIESTFLSGPAEPRLLQRVGEFVEAVVLALLERAPSLIEERSRGETTQAVVAVIMRPSRVCAVLAEALEGVHQEGRFEARGRFDPKLSEAHCQLCRQIEVISAVFGVARDDVQEALRCSRHVVEVKRERG